MRKETDNTPTKTHTHTDTTSAATTETPPRRASAYNPTTKTADNTRDAPCINDNTDFLPPTTRSCCGVACASK